MGRRGAEPQAPTSHGVDYIHREVARSRGVKFGGEKTYAEHQTAEQMKKRTAGEGYGTIARSMGMSRSMVQRIVQAHEPVSVS